MTVTERQSAIEERYGRTPAKRRQDRTVVIVVGALFAAVLVGWVIWAGLDQRSGTLEVVDTGHAIVDARTVRVSFQLSAPVGSTASCALQAQNEAHGIVGWKIVELPASTRYTNSYTELLRSSEQAVTGLIYRCWLT